MQAQNIKAEFIPPTDSIKSVFKKNISIHYEIEHLLSYNCWQKIKELGYVSERTSSELNGMLGNHADINRATKEVFEDLIPDDTIRETIVYYEPEKSSKDKIFAFVNKATEEEQKEYMSGFQKLVTNLKNRFVVKQSEDVCHE